MASSIGVMDAPWKKAVSRQISDALVTQLPSSAHMLDLENTKRLNQYVSGQVETIKEIHSLMTSDLKRHYTIEELSKQYLMNTTTLKSVFKAVYGMPIASYMKEYRMKSASNMLLHEDKSISEIAAAVGYKSQSKFTSAFRDIFQILPTAYQKLYRNQ